MIIIRLISIYIWATQKLNSFGKHMYGLPLVPKSYENTPGIENSF